MVIVSHDGLLFHMAELVRLLLNQSKRPQDDWSIIERTTDPEKRGRDSLSKNHMVACIKTVATLLRMGHIKYKHLFLVVILIHPPRVELL